MFNFKFGGRSHSLSLGSMHKSIGSRVFKRLSPGEQKRWSSYDRNMSRRQMKRSGGGKMRSIRF